MPVGALFIESFTESGSAFNLRNSSQDLDSVTTVLGAEISYAISTALGIISPQIRVGWLHEYENDSRTVKAVYPGDPGATPINVFTDSPDRNSVPFGASILATLPRGFSAFLDYGTVFALDDV